MASFWLSDETRATIAGDLRYLPSAQSQLPLVRPSGTLRFSCSLAGGRQLLLPFVVEYLRRHSRMKVEIVTEGRLVDIIKDGFDAGVRLAEAVPQDMIAMPLGPQARHVVVGAHADRGSGGAES